MRFGETAEEMNRMYDLAKTRGITMKFTSDEVKLLEYALLRYKSELETDLFENPAKTGTGLTLHADHIARVQSLLETVRWLHSERETAAERVEVKK